MAGTPRYKVYDADGTYIAATKEVEHAAMLLAGLNSSGATIRDGHRRADVLWTDGVDGVAGDSFDEVAILAGQRLTDRRVTS